MSELSVTTESLSVGSLFATEEDDRTDREQERKVSNASFSALNLLSLLLQQEDRKLGQLLNVLALHGNPRDRDFDRRGNDRDVEVKAGAEVRWSWGDKDGSRCEVSVKGSASDRNGNYIEGDVQYDSKGRGSARVEAGHDTERGK